MYDKHLIPLEGNRNVSRDQILRELRREMATRLKVYPGWVASGRITRATAERRLGALEGAIKLIESLNPQLF